MYVEVGLLCDSVQHHCRKYKLYRTEQSRVKKHSSALFIGHLTATLFVSYGPMCQQ